ncbi:MAG: 50S ribosomal protein L29 [Lentisphaeria bacterium]|nr:50S ribosomal protein L29 [Lentisphaeria bacterium]
MKAAQIRELTDEELERSMAENRREAFNLRMQQQTGQLENTGRIRQVRRDIARLETERTARARRQAEVQD